MTKLDRAIVQMDALCHRADSIVHGGGYEHRADAAQCSNCYLLY